MYSIGLVLFPIHSSLACPALKVVCPSIFMIDHPYCFILLCATLYVYTCSHTCPSLTPLLRYLCYSPSLLWNFSFVHIYINSPSYCHIVYVLYSIFHRACYSVYLAYIFSSWTYVILFCSPFFYMLMCIVCLYIVIFIRWCIFLEISTPVLFAIFTLGFLLYRTLMHSVLLLSSHLVTSILFLSFYSFKKSHKALKTSLLITSVTNIIRFPSAVLMIYCI